MLANSKPLDQLTSSRGYLEMLAIDQRGSLRKMLGKTLGADQDAVDAREVVAVKKAIVEILSPKASAVLIDPDYGYPDVFSLRGPKTGLLVSREHSGPEKVVVKGRTEQRTVLLKDWDAARMAKVGAAAVKLLVQYHPETSADTRQHNQGVIRQVGAEAARAGLVFLLEVTTYDIYNDTVDSAEFAKTKPKLVAGVAAEFSRPEYQVDILKLEFPGDLKYVSQFAQGQFDNQKRQSVYSLKDVGRYCDSVTAASRLPWVILSAGVGIDEFVKQIEIATAHGASGFLGGRAIWKEAVPLYKSGDDSAMRSWLKTQGIKNIERAKQAAGRAKGVW